MFLLLILDITLEMRHEQSRHEFLSLDFCLPVIMKIFPYVFFQVFLPSHLDPLFTWNWPLLDWFYSIFMGISEKATATHSSTLAWKIPWMEEPGRLQSMGLRRVGHDSATSLSLFTFMHWRRKWQPTPMFLPGESQGRGSLVGCHLWGRTESHMTEVT